MSVGNALLDKHHMLLLQLTRSFVEESARASDEAFQGAFADILDVAQRHCRAEEHALLLNGFEWLEQHRHEHVAGLDRLQALWVEVACAMLPRSRLVDALVDWLVHHHEDMDLPARDWLAYAPGRLGDLDGWDPLDARG